MGKDEVLGIIASSALPERLKLYLAASLGPRRGSRLGRLLKKDPVSLAGNLAALFRSAEEALAVDAGEAVSAAGFNYNNAAPGRLGAALAELRAAVFLRGEGFSGIQLLPQAASKTADLSACRGGKTYAFEVCCLAGGPPLAARVEPAAGKLTALLCAKYRKKIAQARTCRKKSGLTNCGLFIALDPEGFGPPPDPDTLAALAAEVYRGSDIRPGEHLCLISGETAAVFPAWD